VVSLNAPWTVSRQNAVGCEFVKCWTLWTLYCSRHTCMVALHCAPEYLLTFVYNTYNTRVKQSEVNATITLPVRRRWSPQASPIQPGISEHCETTDTGWCIMRCACLLSQLWPGAYSSLTTEGGLRLRLRLSRPGCLVLRRGGLPVQRRSPTISVVTLR